MKTAVKDRYAKGRKRLTLFDSDRGLATRFSDQPMMNQMREMTDRCVKTLKRMSLPIFRSLFNVSAVFALSVLCFSCFGGVATAQSMSPVVEEQTQLAYNIDFGMDLARAEQTIEYYGEELRDLVEQALRNNQNHPESKDTAKNSYQRESTLNDVLPEKRSSAFSKDDLVNLRSTKNPKDLLR